MKPCSWCENMFDATVSYQIYCSPTCRNEATKVKIANKQALNKRKKRIGKDRKCARGCGTTLSMYNDVNYCPNCTVDPKELHRMLNQIKGYVQYEQE